MVQGYHSTYGDITVSGRCSAYPDPKASVALHSVIQATQLLHSPFNVQRSPLPLLSAVPRQYAALLRWQRDEGDVGIAPYAKPNSVW